MIFSLFPSSSLEDGMRFQATIPRTPSAVAPMPSTLSTPTVLSVSSTAKSSTRLYLRSVVLLSFPVLMAVASLVSPQKSFLEVTSTFYNSNSQQVQIIRTSSSYFYSWIRSRQRIAWLKNKKVMSTMNLYLINQRKLKVEQVSKCQS